MEISSDDCSPDERPQERFAHQKHQVSQKQYAAIEDERRASIASELIAHPVNLTLTANGIQDESRDQAAIDAPKPIAGRREPAVA
jgi:hypothetical protein